MGLHGNTEVTLVKPFEVRGIANEDAMLSSKMVLQGCGGALMETAKQDMGVRRQGITDSLCLQGLGHTSALMDQFVQRNKVLFPMSRQP